MVHRPYWRATAVGLSLVLTACSLGAFGLRVKHGVSLRAVVRYFTRPHLRETDLSRHLRHRETGFRIETLLDSGDPAHLGGLVYAGPDSLSFYPHGDSTVARRWRAEWENRTLYARLVPLYHRAAVAELIAVLSSPEVRTALDDRGVDVVALADLERRLFAVREEEDVTRLLRRMAPLIQSFTPTPLSPSWLDLGDRLRFYERSDPPGQYVGQFAVLDPGWGARFEEDEARRLSRRNHYLLITRVGERILLLDFHRGQVRRYDLRPFDHRTGNRLYRLTADG